MKTSKISYFLSGCLLGGLLFACEEVKSLPVNETLRNLVDKGYSIQELSLRTNYSEETLTQVYFQSEDILKDSVANQKLLEIEARDKEKQIVPIRNVDLTAEDALWEIYSRAKNLARISMYTGIGTANVFRTISSKTPLSETDSVKAMVGLVNMKYGLKEMPASVESYYYNEYSIQDVVVPVTFQSHYSDEIRRKIDFYLHECEKWEIKANEKLQQAIYAKIDKHVESAVNDFISDELDGYINDFTNYVKSSLYDSTEIADSFKEKLADHLALDSLEKSINDELIAYIGSVNCSRRMLVNEILHYDNTSQLISSTKRVKLQEYVDEMENLSTILDAKYKENNIEMGRMITGVALMSATTAVAAPFLATGVGAVPAVIALDLIADRMVAETFEHFFHAKDKRAFIREQIGILQQRIKESFNRNVMESIEGQGSINQQLDQSTDAYYQSIREFYNIDGDEN